MRPLPSLAVIALAALAVLAAACTSSADSQPEPSRTARPTATTAPTPAPAERYHKLACPYDVPLNRYTECGYLLVPENRHDPDSKYIKLSVTVVKSDSPDPRPDPIVYLDGGPGGSTLEIAFRVFEGWFAPFATDRDVILFDQRGIGKSEPALDCPQFNAAFRQSVEQDIRREQLSALIVTALKDCHNRLVAAGTDLSGYTSAESAADLDELRRALGYEEWNLYGISYGTRLALTTMRDYPQGIRSVVLDSSYSPEVDLYAELIPNAQRAFDTLFDGCAADAACNSSHPNLRTVLSDLVNRLNASPATLEVVNFATDEHIQAKMSGDLLQLSLFQALYSSEAIPYLPAVIYAAHEGDLEVLTPLVGDLFFIYDTISIGMHYAVQCAEEAPFGSPESYAAAAAAHPEISHAFDVQPIYTICENWEVTPAGDVENQPVTSDIPTLVLAGEYDPITPPAWGEQVAQRLSRGYYFRFPGVGHGASVSDACPYVLMLDFLDDPAAVPDGSCIGSMTGPLFATGP
jgi:pimeloyl-ACP methyl ester carboxylesterase